MATLPAESPRFPPIDECTSDRSFVQFREQLQQAVERKDARAILDVLDENVLIDFGGGHGRPAFVEAWRLDETQPSPLWDELKEILRLGCAVSGEVRVMPSMAVQSDDTYDLIVVEPAALRELPSDDAPAIARLHWDAVTFEGNIQNNDWYGVSLADGRRGFVRSHQVRSPIDYRITIERVDGRWTITRFVGGD